MTAWLMGIRTISPTALQQRMREGGVTVLDVNASGSWTKARVPGAINLDAAGFRDNDLPRDRSAARVFYCSDPMCCRAPIAARRARRMG